MGIQNKLVTVTPQMAKDYLANNENNRTIRKYDVKKYAAEIRAGNWQVNGESIKIDKNGNVIDGQHRLAAGVEADMPFQTFLVTGLPPKVQVTVDAGVSRKLGDFLKMRGVPDYNVVGAVVRLVWNYENGITGYKAKRGERSTPPSVTQLLETFDAQAERILTAAKVGRHVRQGLPIPITPVAVLHYLVYPIDHIDADDFFDRLASGENMESGDPLYAMRRLMMRRDRLHRYPTEHLLALLIKTWNAYREGASVSQVVYKPGGKTPEAFPTPR